MRDAFIVGVYTSRFGKLPDVSVKALTSEAVLGVLADAGIDRRELETAWFSNSA